MTTQTALSRAASISVAAISESADALLRRGLLVRETDERDRRTSRLSLTHDGRLAVAAAEKVLDDLAVILAAGMASLDLKAVSATFDRLNANVTQHLMKVFDN